MLLLRFFVTWFDVAGLSEDFFVQLFRFLSRCCYFCKIGVQVEGETDWLDIRVIWSLLSCCYSVASPPVQSYTRAAFASQSLSASSAVDGAVP